MVKSIYQELNSSVGPPSDEFRHFINHGNVRNWGECLAKRWIDDEHTDPITFSRLCKHINKCRKHAHRLLQAYDTACKIVGSGEEEMAARGLRLDVLSRLSASSTEWNMMNDVSRELFQIVSQHGAQYLQSEIRLGNCLFQALP
jgi:hypothetical protein